MWYVLYCPGQEQEMIRLCKTHVSDVALQDAFVLTYERMRRYKGAWQTEKKQMFPGYVFLESLDGLRLKEEIDTYQELVQILGNDDVLVPIREEEESFLRSVCGSEHHFAMSKGIIRGGVTLVTEGPLQGKESMIKKIDRHKRLAYLNAPAFLPEHRIQAGLEITEKTA